jgi:type VI secretion system protein VasD
MKLQKILLAMCGAGLLAMGASCGKAPPSLPSPPPTSLPTPPALPPITIAAPRETPQTPVKASMTLTASADVNPDVNRQPKPVVVRIYQLRNDATFKAVQFEPLYYDDEKKTLSETFLTRDEFMLKPGERQAMDVTLASETRYVGVLAAFRDLTNPATVWKIVVPAPKRSLAVEVTAGRVSAVVDGAP